MRRLDQRGAVAFEFCLVAVVLFTFFFAIFDLGRYAIAMQSLRALASNGARATMIKCYTPAVTGIVANTSPSSCIHINAYLASDLILGQTPTLSASSGGSVLTITAALPDFAMLMPIWGTSLNAPSASMQIPY
ncbi:MAG: pilus assembly protein [Beijerinckiaceae bacterium]|nr:pilus assembly protein [Beijerinckiaceae bacterium]